MPKGLGPDWRACIRGVETLRADTGLAVGSVPAGPRVAKLDRVRKPV